MKPVTVRYDDREITLSARVVETLIAHMEAVAEMHADMEPKFAKCWQTGRCTINDWASAGGMEFTYGERGDFDDGLGDFAVVRGVA